MTSTDSPQMPPSPAPATRAAEPGRWLAIETSGLFGSIAAGVVSREGCDLALHEPLPRDARSARTLAPTIDALLKRLAWPPADLDAVVVAVGPGSFTGLRVGVATAKTLAWGVNAAILGVDTLDALAEAAEPPSAGATHRLWTALDAQRGELFAARFTPAEGRWRRDTLDAGSAGKVLGQTTLRIDRAALLLRLSAGDRLVGPTAPSLGAPDGVVVQDAEPRADAVLRVARRRWLAGEADSVFGLAPRYHRQSAAEEKLSPA